MNGVTQILQQIEDGDPSAAEQLLPLVYEELRKLAAARMAAESPDHTLQSTALVHEAYVRLVDGQPSQHWNSRGHFFGAAAEAMRRILVEQARHKASRKRGGGRKQVSLEQISVAHFDPPIDILDLDEALARLQDEHPRMAELVKLRFFAGLSPEETAHVLGIAVATANRDWTYARAWLFGAMTNE